MAENQTVNSTQPVALNRTGFAFLVVTAIGFVAAVIWISFPEIDLWVSNLFERGDYSDARRFFLREHPIAKFLNNVIEEGAQIGVLLILFGLVFTSTAHRTFLGLTTRKYWFLLASFVTGPLLVANALFKENWGRARPRDVTEFGGDFLFTPPLMITDQCDTNCSFISGDASLAFTMIAVAFVAPELRTRWLALATGFGVLIGLTRIVQGAHFLSDTLFAAVFMSLSVLLMYMIVMEQRWGISRWCEIWIGSTTHRLWCAGKRALGALLDKIRPGSRDQIRTLLVELGFKARNSEMETPVFRSGAVMKERLRFFFGASLEEINAVKRQDLSNRNDVNAATGSEDTRK